MGGDHFGPTSSDKGFFVKNNSVVSFSGRNTTENRILYFRCRNFVLECDGSLTKIAQASTLKTCDFICAYGWFTIGDFGKIPMIS